jgi:hypothetical protein
MSSFKKLRLLIIGDVIKLIEGVGEGEREREGEGL